ncbi:hormogonium polysaccharide secretion pseudopilin HpsC [Microcoleus sp.]|uniref:hormogonium polysaccharide secretion pseudopilin HpsC n=1 Tax=Microcoleus sp. TaxID=44472 RepID=UPI0035939517
MKSLLRLLLKTQHQQNRSHPTKTEKGMTLVELLVGSIMAFLIITPMLAFVVDMLNTDRREQVKANTEQDLQAAVDFIGQDLNQAIYIYDKTAIDLIRNQLPAAGDATKTPILVFWKRQQIKNAVPVNATLTPKPSNCKPDPLSGKAGECNDTYVLSLVAYYQIKDTTPNPIWCQPLGGTCPTRIARYEIRDGVKDPSSSDPTNPYYSLTDANEYAPNEAFEPSFNISKPTLNVTKGAKFKDAEVLVNYIDHSPKAIDPAECKNALGNPTDPKNSPLEEKTLKVTDTDNINSFYACVDTARNTARVTIRGNSLRRLQTNDTAYDDKKSAFFPTATVQVKGLGGLGN